MTREGGAEAVSPELVLVDSVLFELSRTRLAEPDDTLARVDILIQTSRMASLARRSMEVPRQPAADLVESSHRISRSGRRRSAAFVGGLAAGTFIVALLVGVRVDLSGTPAGADSVVAEEMQEPPVTSTLLSPVEEPRIDRPPPTTKPSSQRFAWAPAVGASAYHIELFRGSSKVFEADTKQAAMTIPPRWEFAGRTYSLEPGEYRWNVWPVVSGQRAARAIVQAQLVVRGR